MSKFQSKIKTFVQVLPKLRSSRLSRQKIPVVEGVMTLKMFQLFLSLSLHSRVCSILASVHVVFVKERFHFGFWVLGLNLAVQVEVPSWHTRRAHSEITASFQIADC